MSDATVGAGAPAPTPSAPAVTDTRRRRRGGRNGDRLILGAMIGVPTALHVVFVWFPALATIVLSFTNWDGFSRVPDIRFVGFRNYWEIFTVFEKNFIAALINNSVLLIFLFVGPTALGMFCAYLLDKNLRGSRLYQSVLYLPVVLSLAVVGFIWKSVMYSPRQGLFSTILGRTDPANQIDWLGDRTHLISIGGFGVSKNFAAILIAIAWRHVGYIMVLYLAGLKSVDASLREAAALDGCNEWQTFRKVIFPTMRPINVIVFVITTIEALRAFDIVFALKTPRGMELLSILVTNNLLGEGGGNVGRGSAYGVILLLMCVGSITWYVVTLRKEHRS